MNTASISTRRPRVRRLLRLGPIHYHTRRTILTLPFLTKNGTRPPVTQQRRRPRRITTTSVTYRSHHTILEINSRRRMVLTIQDLRGRQGNYKRTTIIPRRPNAQTDLHRPINERSQRRRRSRRPTRHISLYIPSEDKKNTQRESSTTTLPGIRQAIRPE